MATVLRLELSQNNKYYIDKRRYYKLKHFCLQYPEWKQTYTYLDDPAIPISTIDYIPSDNIPRNPTAKRAMAKLYYSERIKLIEKTAIEIDPDPYLYAYIIKGVTEERSYTYLKN